MTQFLIWRKHPVKWVFFKSTILEYPSEVLALTVQGVDGRINNSNISLEFDIKSLQRKVCIIRIEE